MKPQKEIPPHEALREFFAKNTEVKRADMAREMDCSRAIISRWCNGIGTPNRQRAARLEAMTGIKETVWKRLGRGVDSPAIKRLQQYADEKRISCTELARELGIPQRNMARYFHGGMPEDGVIDLINKHFGWKLKRMSFLCVNRKRRSLRPSQ